jgi:hypothetical protein
MTWDELPPLDHQNLRWTSFRRNISKMFLRNLEFRGDDSKHPEYEINGNHIYKKLSHIIFTITLHPDEGQNMPDSKSKNKNEYGKKTRTDHLWS